VQVREAMQNENLSRGKLNCMQVEDLAAGVEQVSQEICDGEFGMSDEGDDADMTAAQLPGEAAVFTSVKAQLVHHQLRKKRQNHELLLQVLKLEKLSLWSHAKAAPQV
jgi:hypothetical protein